MSFSEDLLTMEVPCNLRAPATVRDALADVHDGAWSLDDGRLVASELVGNAVRHSGCRDEHRLKIAVRLRNERLLISVHDPGLSGEAASPAGEDSLAPGGWGLRIVEELTEAWGTDRPDGYRVWAELAAHANPQAGVPADRTPASSP
jgi:anti-sigma regulatory factor (Ser/Thr protein kinase)